MFTRFAAVAFSVLLLGACEEASTPSEQASACSGLNQADCTAKNECAWNADKGECVAK
jgi:hypothetical protein